ncbi:MAG TPA: alpha/beta hydrolase [Nevskiaceae bacterium]|nr:alpha/beta hydrolase [Nevskiaceae bacterium]
MNDPAQIRLQANGVDFCALELGRGPLVLLLHGFPDTAWSFVPVMRHLAAAGYRAVAPFMRGYPPSGLAPDGDYGVPALGRDALALIAALGEERAVLVGHDWGAAAAYVAAALEPARISHLVTAAVPHVHRFVYWPTLRQLRRSRYMLFFQLRGLPERRIVAGDFRWLRALIREWSPAWNFGEAEFAPLQQAFSDPARLAAALAYYRAMPRSLFGREGRKLVATRIAVPARVIRGADDGCIGAEMFDNQEQWFSTGYELITLRGAGHFMQCEQPEAFARAVLGFVR